MESARESVQKLGILLIGKTGNGKSSAGNKLLGKNVFKVRTGLSPVTKTVESGKIQIFGKTLKVVDTPDITNLPDRKLSKAEATAIINKWRSKIASMPYIVLLAIKCNEEYSQKEFAIYQQIKEMWGDRPNSLCQSLVVLFTFGDRQGENFCGRLKECTSPLRDVLHDARDRYLIFSTKIDETRDLFHRFDNLCSERSQVDASRPDPSQSNTQDELCLLIIGKTGNGKSTGGNLLLSKHLFNTGVGLSSTTTTIQTGTGSFEGRNFKVIDTPDIFNQEMCKDDQKKEIEKWKQMVLPEPYVILLAVRCDVRYSPEEFSLYQRIKELWGEETFCKHLMVLFTFGDRAGGEIKQELKTVCQELKNVLKDAQGRYIVLSEKADFKSTQNEIKTLFNKLVKSDKDTLTSLPMP